MKSLPATGASTIRVGAIFPLSGPAASLGGDEYAGVELAATLMNAQGGLRGRRIVFDTRDVPTTERVASAVRGLKADGVSLIVGGYSSDISIPAAADTAHAGLVYWEAGAEADQVTGQELPTVFRVGATGSQLGDNSVRFFIDVLAAHLHVRLASIRAAVVTADDAYATSVSRAVLGRLRTAGVHVASVSRYDAYRPDWQHVIAQLRRARPTVLFLSSHIPDGVAFRRAYLAAHLHTRVFIGTTMAQCKPDFGAALGADAVGVFASDRPGDGFDPSRLPPAGQALYARLAAAWFSQYHESPDEEALAGFSAGWVLFHDVLAKVDGPLTTTNIAGAARTVDLPAGTLPDGAGVKFASSRSMLGQNLRAAAVVWQWQAPRHSVVVWPAPYATGKVNMRLARS
jgi:branched-chain amino acid transport system substrate-binding protein